MGQGTERLFAEVYHIVRQRQIAELGAVVLSRLRKAPLREIPHGFAHSGVGVMPVQKHPAVSRDRIGAGTCGVDNRGGELLRLGDAARQGELTRMRGWCYVSA